MSMVANLDKEQMTCECPACGEMVDVDECDFNGMMDNGDKEYSVECPDCGQVFYVAESYFDDEWERRKYEEGINSKFKIGQTVFGIVHSTLKKRVTCTACNGKGKVELNNGKLYDCPECYGHGYKEIIEPKAYRIAYESRIGKIEIEIYKTSFKEIYMLEATGIGSGLLWDSDKLFAVREEAEEYCNRMNAGANVQIDAIHDFK